MQFKAYLLDLHAPVTRAKQDRGYMRPYQGAPAGSTRTGDQGQQDGGTCVHIKAHLLDLHAPATRANKIEGTCVHIKAHLLDLHAPVTRAKQDRGYVHAVQGAPAGSARTGDQSQQDGGTCTNVKANGRSAVLIARRMF